MIPVILVAGLALREAVGARKRSLAEDAVYARSGRPDDVICTIRRRVYASDHTGQSGTVDVTLTQQDVQQVASQAAPELSQNAPPGSDLDQQWQGIATHIAADQKAGFITAEDAQNNAKLASLALWNSFSDFAKAASNDGPSLGDIDQIAAAGEAVAVRFTSSGASQLMVGLVKQGIVAGSQELQDLATQALTPIAQKAVQHLCGSLVAGLGTVALGITATGVGCVIGAAVGVVAGILAGLLGGSSPPAYQIGNCGLNPKPDIVIKYTWMWRDEGAGNPICSGGPGSFCWRKFPTPQTEPDWFKHWGADPSTPYGKIIPGTNIYAIGMNGPGPMMTLLAPTATDKNHRETWWPCYTFPADQATRPIDHAFYDLGSSCQPPASSGQPCSWQDADEIPVYFQLEAEQQTPIFTFAGVYQMQFRDFLKLYFHLWKQNREFQLNGLQPLADWQVLLHAQTTWNNAHEGNVKLSVPASSNPPISAFGNGGAPPLPVFTTYAQWLLSKYGNMMGISHLTLNMGDVIISHENLPPAGLVPKLLPGGLHLPFPFNFGGGSKPSTPSTPVKATPQPVASKGGATAAGNVVGSLLLLGTLGTAALMKREASSGSSRHR